MTLLPRMTISPIVTPSRGTSVSTSSSRSSTTRMRSALIMPIPCRDFSFARSSTGRPVHSGCGSHEEYGP